MYKIEERRYHVVGKCVTCNKVAPIAPWGDNPQCFKCSGCVVIRYEEDTKTAFFYEERYGHPLFYENACWYFWNETWDYRYGPFECQEDAQKALDEYARSL